MLFSVLTAPFADAARQAHFDGAQQVLEAAGVTGVLLGNLEVAGETLDAVVVLPHCVAVLHLLPGGGQLTVPRLTTGTWLLDGQPLPGFDPADENPLRLWQRQREAAVAWLASQPETAEVPEAAVTGLVVFGRPVTFGADVEANLRVQPAANTFQLVASVEQLPRRLRQLEPLLTLDAASLQRWAHRLLPRPAPADYASVPDAEQEPEPAGFWTEKARQLWRWLGAEDVPADPPYGGVHASAVPDAVAASQQEKQHLEQMRQQVRTEVSQQTQAMEAREAERDHTIAQLRQQLAAASAAAPETARLQAQLAAEAREKAALEEAIRAARTESAARNRELDARIQQLSRQIEQMQSRPAPAAPVQPAAPVRRPAATPATTAAPSRSTPPAAPAPMWRLHWGRLAAVVVVAGSLGAAAAWGIRQVPFGQRPATEQSRRAAARPAPVDENLEAVAPTLFDIQPDTVVLQETEPATTTDTTIIREALPAPEEGQVMDSVTAPDEDI